MLTCRYHIAAKWSQALLYAEALLSFCTTDGERNCFCQAPQEHCSNAVGTLGPQTHLKHAHAKGVPQNAVGVLVEAVSDGGGGDEEGERVLLLRIQQALALLPIHLPLPFLPMTAKPTQQAQGVFTLSKVDLRIGR